MDNYANYAQIMQMEGHLGVKGSCLCLLWHSVTPRRSLLPPRLSPLPPSFASLLSVLRGALASSTPVVFLGASKEPWPPSGPGMERAGTQLPGWCWARWHLAAAFLPPQVSPAFSFPGQVQGYLGYWPFQWGLLIIQKECSLRCRFGKSLRWPLPQLCL